MQVCRSTSIGIRQPASGCFGRRTRWDRRPAPQPELADEAWRAQAARQAVQSCTVASATQHSLTAGVTRLSGSILRGPRASRTGAPLSDRWSARPGPVTTASVARRRCTGEGPLGRFARGAGRRPMRRGASAAAGSAAPPGTPRSSHSVGRALLPVAAIIGPAIWPRPAEMSTGPRNRVLHVQRGIVAISRMRRLPRSCLRRPAVDYTARRGRLVGFALSALLVGLVGRSDQPGELLEPVLAEHLPEPGIRLGCGVSPGHRPSSVTLADFYGGAASLRRPRPLARNPEPGH